MKINVRTISHEDQRYPTCGDWWVHNGSLEVRVSYMGDLLHENLIAIHEIVEALLCLKSGISEESVTAWDKAFTGSGEPGDDPAAPYYDQHVKATAIERTLADMLGIDWETYVEETEWLYY